MALPPAYAALTDGLQLVRTSLESQLRQLSRIESGVRALERHPGGTPRRANAQAALVDDLREVKQLQQNAQHLIDTALRAAKDLAAT